MTDCACDRDHYDMAALKKILQTALMDGDLTYTVCGNPDRRGGRTMTGYTLWNCPPEVVKAYLDTLPPIKGRPMNTEELAELEAEIMSIRDPPRRGRLP